MRSARDAGERRQIFQEELEQAANCLNGMSKTVTATRLLAPNVVVSALADFVNAELDFFKNDPTVLGLYRCDLLGPFSGEVVDR
jgi:hypothetical protein